MGKGEGNLISDIFGCVYLFFVVGPILIILGIVFLVIPNQRKELVEKYNTAVDNYTPDTEVIGTWSGTTYQSHSDANGTFSVVTEAVVTPDGDDDVKAATSHFANASIPKWDFILDTVPITVNASFLSFQQDVPMTKTEYEKAYCTSDACSGSCIPGFIVCNDDTVMRDQVCRKLYNGAATFVRERDCELDGLCGNCRYTAYLEQACIPIDVSNASNNIVQPDAGKKSCYYPFLRDSNIYSSSIPLGIIAGESETDREIVVQLRSTTDPFIVFQELTQGSTKFGLTATEEIVLGIICIVLGILLTIASVAICTGCR